MKTNNTPDRRNGEAFEQVNDDFSNKNSQAKANKVAGMHIEWSEDENRVTQMAGLAYFVEFLNTTNLFEHFVETCPLSYQSNNTSDKRDVLGTVLLSVLSGHSRYAHINALRGSGLDAELLQLSGLTSEDSIRRALRKLVATEATQLQTRSWLSGCFEQVYPGVLEKPWILDVDVTVKSVYGTQKWMQELEDVDLLYWFRLKQSKAVRELIGLIERENDWMQSSPSGSGWSYCESTLQLSGWNRSRRVVVYRRVHRRKVPSKLKALLPGPTEQSKQLALELVEEALTKYEYAVYVTTLKQPAGQIRSLYNPRGDNENSYDELKNQWGWCGFTLKDLARSELMACLIALIYNGWSLYTKLVEEEIAREAITSRPMFLMHVAKASTHQSMRFLVIFCAHAQLNQIKKKLEIATLRLKEWASLTAEQLKARSLWKRIIGHILSYHRSFGGQSYRAPPMIEAPV